jgi:hypothetical protein
LSGDVMSMRSGHTKAPYMDVFNAKKGDIGLKTGQKYKTLPLISIPYLGATPMVSPYLGATPMVSHQGIENVIPIQFDYPDKPARPEEVGCTSSLGGMLNHYYINKKAA